MPCRTSSNNVLNEVASQEQQHRAAWEFEMALVRFKTRKIKFFLERPPSIQFPRSRLKSSRP